MRARPLSRADAPHRDRGAGCDGLHVCAAAGLSVIGDRLPPGPAETPHRHAAAARARVRVIPAPPVQGDRPAAEVTA